MDIFNTISNAIKNGLGIDRDIYQLIYDKDIDKVKSLLQNRDNEVLDALKEYNPEDHEVMNRPNKKRKGKDPYITQKLPRSWQRYINEISLFFLLSKPIVWRNASEDKEETEEAFNAFKEFLKETRFDTTMRQAKRLAGAETESAKIYHIYQDEGKPKVKVIVISKGKGYYLRPLFNQYENMLSFGYGYFLKEGGKSVEHFDILTPKGDFFCKKTAIGWEVKQVYNPIGKNRVIYYRQPKEWEGGERRIARDEWVDSKAADVNEYFADPQAAATVDVIKNLADPSDVGKMIQLSDERSRFEYIEPPTSLEMKESEKKILRESIHQDTFTPDFSFEAMIGRGDLSGEAIKRAMILGYIKRDNRLEIYDELVDREKNLILSIMENVTHIHLSDKIKKLEIEHEFAEPFDEDRTNEWASIGRAYTDGIISLDTAVKLMGVANPAEEINKIQEAQAKEKEETNYPIGE